LYWHFFEFVEHLRPKAVIMENVPEILIKANGFFRDAVFERFGKMGYNVSANIVNAAEFGVPQRRRRAIFLAGRDGLKIPFPETTHRPGVRAGRRTPTSKDFIETAGRDNGSLMLFEPPPEGATVWDAIGDLHGKYAKTLDGVCGYARKPATEYQRERRGDLDEVHNHFPWPLSERQLSRIRLLREGEGQLHLPAELQTREGYGSAYRRMQADAQALTLTTWMFHPGSGMFTHPKDDRVVTIREAARLQSFQDDFVFTGRYHSQCRQVGNSVAPLMATNVARAISAALQQPQDKQDAVLERLLTVGADFASKQ
jgi:DNA (cytosine-5)-methyltransferase 1